MKELKLTKGYIVMVDNEDYDFLSQWKWSYSGIGYAVRCHHYYKETGKRHSKTILMHREILKAPIGMEVDHINGNRSDNRKSNLRLCTRQENAFNNSSKKKSTSIYRGASYHVGYNKWLAQLIKDGKHYFLGWHKTEIEAGYAFDQKAKELYGEFARLNVIKKEDVIFHTLEYTSNFRGVSWSKSKNKWASQIQYNHKQLNLGRYLTEKEAALAYNQAAIKYHGDKAKLNVVD